MYNMYLISAEWYENANVDFLPQNMVKDESYTKSNKNVYVRNYVMTTVIKRCRGKKARGIRAIDGFRKKVMIPDSEILKCPEFEVKSKIGNIF